MIILEKIQSLSKWKRHIAEIALIVLTALAAEYTKLDGGAYGIAACGCILFIPRQRS